MSEKYMPAEKAIKMHLSKFQPQNGIHVFSGFIAALGDARSVTGRDENGAKIDRVKHGCWLGAIGYMALLDQIGSCFKPMHIPTEAGNTIRKALKYFTSLSDAEIDAIYALRCAFAHDFSLYNINKKYPSLTHQFQVKAGGTLTVVTLPKTAWDGDYTNKNQNNLTIINLEGFGDLVEGICNRLVQLASSNQLDVVLADGTDELLQRYSYYASSAPIPSM